MKCPLCFEYDNPNCIEDVCAWWNRDNRECSIVTIGDRL